MYICTTAEKIVGTLSRIYDNISVVFIDIKVTINVSFNLKADMI
jgi:hypothetical protein